MAKRSRKKSGNGQNLQQQLEETAIAGSQMILTAGSIVLAEDWGFPPEWIEAWTIKTMAVALMITEGLPPTEEIKDKLEDLWADPDTFQKNVEKLIEEHQKKT